jgi:hypothetical protein
MKNRYELVEEWIWNGFDGCDEYDWAELGWFDPPREIIMIGPDDKEIIYRGKRYEVDMLESRCLLYSLDDIFMDHPAFCLYLRKI